MSVSAPSRQKLLFFYQKIGELVGIWAKVIKARDDVAVKDAVLTAIIALYDGTGGPMRHEPAAEAVLKLLTKLISDKSPIVRTTAAVCVGTIVRCVPDAALELDTFVPSIVKNLKDADTDVSSFSVYLPLLLFMN